MVATNIQLSQHFRVCRKLPCRAYWPARAAASSTSACGNSGGGGNESPLVASWRPSDRLLRCLLFRSLCCSHNSCCCCCCCSFSLLLFPRHSHFTDGIAFSSARLHFVVVTNRWVQLAFPLNFSSVERPNCSLLCSTVGGPGISVDFFSGPNCLFLRLVFFGFRHEWSTSFIYTTAIVCVSGRPGLQWSVFFVGNGGVLNQSERCSVATIRDREKKEKLFLLSSVQTRDSSNQWHNMSRPSFGLRGTSLLRCRTFFSFFFYTEKVANCLIPVPTFYTSWNAVFVAIYILPTCRRNGKKWPVIWRVNGVRERGGCDKSIILNHMSLVLLHTRTHAYSAAI